jgi:integrase/recombinase XerD
MPKHPTITFTLRRKKGNPIASVAASVSAYKERELWTLDIRIPIECWDEHQRRVVHRKGLVAAGEAHSYNMMIANTRDQFNRVMMHMHLRGEQPTKDAIIRRMALADLGHDFHRWAEARIVELTGIHSPATIRHYRCTFTAMREFMPRMSYADLTCDMVERFDHWLIRNRGLTANSRAKYHKHLKTFSRVLAHDVPGIPDIYARHRIKQTPGKREFLNRMEVNVLERAYSEGDLSPHLMQSLGMFLFSCHTGLRFSDLMHIAWEHVRENYLMFRPQKTRHLDKRIDVPLATTALSYPNYPVGKLFSPISNM